MPCKGCEKNKVAKEMLLKILEEKSRSERTVDRDLARRNVQTFVPERTEDRGGVILLAPSRSTRLERPQGWGLT